MWEISGKGIEREELPFCDDVMWSSFSENERVALWYFPCSLIETVNSFCLLLKMKYAFREFVNDEVKTEYAEYNGPCLT